MPLLACAAATAGLVLFAAATARRAEALAPPAGSFVDVDGVRLHYVDRGTGSVVVMLHGWGGNLRHFHRLIGSLSTTCRVVAVDLPGYGYSSLPSGGHPPLRAQANLIAGFIHRLDLQAPLLLGHSLGGTLSLAIALDHPDCVRALVLVSPLSHVQRLKGWPIRSHVVQRLFAWTLLAPLGKLMWRTAQQAAFAPDAVPPDFDVEGGAVLGLRPGNFVAACRDRAGIDPTLAAMSARYASLALPVDVVFGRHDRLLDARRQGERLVAILRHARLHLADGGHMLPLTMPDLLAAIVRRSL
jgi:pimeloyl-ACP methyl ester carboxylesterase